ncbi:nucleotidyltransferase family protein [Methylotenera oryzisoli]|uniref:Nucleotidyltransferase family protein n=1 Tax=Methylotenera oryzisoli TaxID=2080758 RepID=A0A4Y9VQ79_9PROT|nr:nucleotidyltransferase family protein [Methylotenera oryzisoli]TFW70647.1 nucleotidyltransferase family protein [Methylotenera oryzisoli]
MIGILLAAGFSRRFGPSNKLLQPMADGRPIALASAENLMQAIPTCVAVVRPENTTLAALLQQAGLTVFACKENKQEMADSLSAAIRFSANFEAANHGFVIALADMPYIQPATISMVANRVNSNDSIIIPTYHGQRGHPVGFAARYRSELENLQGDEGARAIVKRYADAVCLLPCEDAGILADIDTPADLKR